MKTPPSERRRVSGEERRAAGGALQSIDDRMNNEVPEYDEMGQYSPDVRAGGSRKPRQSMGLKGLAKGELVTRSPFLQQTGTMGGDDEGNSPLKRNLAAPSPGRYDSPRQPTQEDVFSSPPIQMQGGSGRRISPIYKDRVGSGFNDSPSKRRPSQQGSAESLVPFPSSSQEGTSSSLRAEKPLPPIHHEPSNTATPTKSSITKRRLHGPRLSGSESPTATKQSKTVTFQAVPDVKEFETESVTEDGDKSRDSRDSDVEMDDVDLGDGGDFNPYHAMHHFRADGRGGGSGVVELQDQEYDSEQRTSPSQDEYESNDGHGIRSTDSHASEGVYRDESMTANFIDSLVEDGYFSPPSIQPAQFSQEMSDAQAVPGETPVLNGFMDFTPKLETPSFGSSLGFHTPVAEQPPVLLGPEIAAQTDDKDSAGIPYGRSHHAERVALAHAIPVRTSEPVPQPTLPKPSIYGSEPVLRSANVAEPALPAPNRYSSYEEERPWAHQDGAFIDPFVTIQTATKIHSQTSTECGSANREEDGVPLGRTSHAERAKVARLLATQSLGLGMPKRPIQPSLPSTGRTQTRYISYGESEDGSDLGDESEDERMEQVLQPPVAVIARPQSALATPPKTEETSERRPPLSSKLEALCSPVMASTANKRTLPKPPQPQPLDIPSPKLAPAIMPEDPPRSTSPSVCSISTQSTFCPNTDSSCMIPQVFGVTLPFSLPNIGMTSPLFSTEAQVARRSTESEAVSEATARPLTPPPTLNKIQKAESPHRIPDFDLETDFGKSFEMDTEMDSGTTTVEDFAPLPPLQPRLSLDPLRIVKRSSQFGLDGSINGSRSDGALNRQSTDPASGSLNGGIRQRISKDMIRARMEERKATQTSLSESGSDSEEDLAIEAAGRLSIQLEKALPLPPRFDAPLARPQLRARTQTRSAQDILEQADKDGMPEEPKSALDQLVHDFNGLPSSSQSQRPQSLVVRHVSSESVLTTGPAPSGLPTVSSSTLQPISEMSSLDMTMDDSVVLAPAAVDESARPRRRRSLSTGDARPKPERVRPTCTVSAQVIPMLTVGSHTELKRADVDLKHAGRPRLQG